MTLPGLPTTPEHGASGGARHPSRRQIAWSSWVLALVAQALLLPLLSVERVPLNAQIAGLLAAAVALAPLARWWARGEQTAPMVELICAAYAVQFYQPLFHQGNTVTTVEGPFALEWSTTTRALLLVALGVTSLVVGHAIAKRWRGTVPTLDLQFIPTRRRAFVAVALLIGAVGGALTVVGSAGGPAAALVRLAEAQLYVLVALLTSWGFRNTNGLRWARVLAILVTGIVAVVGLTSGMLERAALPCVVFGIALWQVRRRFPLRLALVGIVVLVVFNAAKGEYRQLAWREDPNMSLSRRVMTWVSLAGHGAQGVVEQSPKVPFKDWLSAALFRFDLLHKFSYVIHMTPDVLPYHHGETYKYLMFSLIPRVFWPSKPSAVEANRTIDTEYGFLNYWQTSTVVIAIGQLPEAFANFGVAGIVVALFLQGALFGLLDRSLNGPHSEGGRAIYLWTMAFFLNGIGSSTAVLFGALVQNALVNAILLRPFSSGFRAPAEAWPASES